jgi:ATP-dependent DNA helicase RecQ
LEASENIVKDAAEMIQNGDVEQGKIKKTVLVIDEAQDMDEHEFALVKALMAVNDDMRIIAVGDDDQNIFEFRGSNSMYMAQLLRDSGGRFIEMVENYRSTKQVVEFANAFVGKIRDRMKRTPIVSMSQSDGSVSVTRHASALMYQPLVKELVSHKGKGTMCVLTQTNEEAAIMVALLRKHGLNGKLIQSMDGFRFWNMAEVRLFLRYLEADTHTPLIADEVWDASKRKTFSKYSDSSSLCYLQRCVQLFEETNKAKYLTDFKEYIFESSAEDFCDLQNADVVVSTIHKSKGMEFDDVYMLISEPLHLTDEVLRKYYVGITRAKQRLFIHANFSFFECFNVSQRKTDSNIYEMPNEIVLQLSHKDVNLGYFKTRKKEVLALRAGQKLRFENNYLYDGKTTEPVCLLSQKIQGELSQWNEKNYFVSDASIRFIVAWRPKDAPKDEKEHAVLLVDLTLNKKS